MQLTAAQREEFVQRAKRLPSVLLNQENVEYVHEELAKLRTMVTSLEDYLAIKEEIVKQVFGLSLMEWDNTLRDWQNAKNSSHQCMECGKKVSFNCMFH